MRVGQNICQLDFVNQKYSQRSNNNIVSLLNFLTMKTLITFKIITALSLLLTISIATAERAIADNLLPVGIKDSFKLAQILKTG
ncbi:MAG: hypothetical protein HC778_04170 [Chamaesiphon sp. CSU_1_12]|nr:hypothetical protein [Chamaesiphon sp. CSU_1_12]